MKISMQSVIADSFMVGGSIFGVHNMKTGRRPQKSKLEVCYTYQHHQMRTRPRRQIRCTENLVKFGMYLFHQRTSGDKRCGMFWTWCPSLHPFSSVKTFTFFSEMVIKTMIVMVMVIVKLLTAKLHLFSVGCSASFMERLLMPVMQKWWAVRLPVRWPSVVIGYCVYSICCVK